MIKSFQNLRRNTKKKTKDREKTKVKKFGKIC